MHKLLRQAFTLIELLVVIAIIGILSGLIVVTMDGVTQKANIAKIQIFSNSLNNSLLINRVAEWKFDEASGNTINDTMNNYSGTLTNGPIRKLGNDCVSGGCLEFDGTANSYIEIPDTDYLPIFSLSAWVYNLSGGDSRHSLLRDFWEIVGNNICFWSYSFINTYWRCSISNSIPYNKWTFVVTTWDGLIIRHYANGKLIWTDPTSSSGTSQRFTTIAGYSGRVFKGRVDELRIYNALASISQIKEQYYAGLNGLLNKGEITEQEYQNRIEKLVIAKE
jgi:prepilin-type N-terminal cleavage/methylation domain-containing protein